MGAEQLRRGGDELAVAESHAGLLEPCVGEAGPQPLGVRRQRVDSFDRLGADRVLVVDRGAAQRLERLGILA
jgi:hypothetical protein